MSRHHRGGIGGISTGSVRGAVSGALHGAEGAVAGAIDTVSEIITGNLDPGEAFKHIKDQISDGDYNNAINIATPKVIEYKNSNVNSNYAGCMGVALGLDLVFVEGLDQGLAAAYIGHEVCKTAFPNP